LSEDAELLNRVQIYLCHKFSGQKLKDIRLLFGIGVSGVSQASRRVALQIKDDKKLEKGLTIYFRSRLVNCVGLTPMSFIMEMM
jgi:hypothetical protein